MNRTLGILVNSDRYFGHLLGLARSARKQGFALLVFCTGPGVRAALEPDFHELAESAEVKFCRKSIDRYIPKPPELPKSSLTNQSWHAELIDRADRYLVL
jgi:hypothetical protein